MYFLFVLLTFWIPSVTGMKRGNSEFSESFTKKHLKRASSFQSYLTQSALGKHVIAQLPCDQKTYVACLPLELREQLFSYLGAAYLKDLLKMVPHKPIIAQFIALLSPQEAPEESTLAHTLEILVRLYKLNPNLDTQLHYFIHLCLQEESRAVQVCALTILKELLTNSLVLNVANYLLITSIRSWIESSDLKKVERLKKRIAILIRAGLDINVQVVVWHPKPQKIHALQLAIQYARADVIQFLLSQGASMYFKEESACSYAQAMISDESQLQTVLQCFDKGA
jgi:hypothetical protein